MASTYGHQEDASGTILLPLPSSLVAAANMEYAAKSVSQYAVNDFISWNDHLYIVTKPIAKNATLARDGDGKNLTSTTVGSQLTALINKMGSAETNISSLTTKVNNLNNYVVETHFDGDATNALNNFITKVKALNDSQFLIGAGDAAMGKLLTGMSGSCMFLAKNVLTSTRIDAFIIQAASAKITLVTINTSTKAVTQTWSNK